MIIKNQSPKGGTELQLGFLHKYVDKNLLDQVQICTSVPGKVPIDPKKLNILWQKNSYDQPNLYPWFKNKANHHTYDWYVFNSHWNYEKFRMVFDIPTEKCVVIKNGVEKIKQSPHYEKGKPIRIIHQNTPWRGLSVLLGAMQLVKNPLITLDVYSSCEEAMSAGLYSIITNYGALFETGAEFPMYIPYDSNYKALAEKFAYGISAAAETLHEPRIHSHLTTQASYAQIYYSWPKQAASWTTFLKGALNAKTK
jgi:glycosyltransferase involved in cell wall biosynthesis